MSRLKDNSLRLEGEFEVAITFVDGVGFYYETDGEEYKINLNEVLSVEVEINEKAESSHFSFISKETGDTVELDEGVLCEITVRYAKLKDVKKFIGICEKNGLRVCMDKECSETYLQGESGGKNEFMELCDGKLLYYVYGCLYEFMPGEIGETVVDENCTVRLNNENGSVMTVDNKSSSVKPLYMTFKNDYYPYAMKFAESLAEAGFNVRGFTVPKLKRKDTVIFGSKNSKATFIFAEEKKLFFDNNGDVYPIDLKDVLCVTVEKSGVISLISKKTGETLETRDGYKCEINVKKSEIDKKDRFIDICEINGISVCMDKECTKTYLQGVNGCNEFMEIHNRKLIYYKFGNFFEFRAKDVSKVHIKGHKIYLTDEDGDIIELEKADGSDSIACMSFKRKNETMSRIFLESLKKIGFNV